jgi:FixJ family two-component response regulator
MVMRGMSGLELATRLRSLDPRLKVIFMSGYTGELISNHTHFGPAPGFLGKPFTRAALLNAVHAALGWDGDVAAAG